MDKLANQQAAEPIDSVYQDLESQLMQNIIRHLRDWKQPIDSDRWLLKKLAEIGKLNKENLAIIAQASGLAVETAMQMLEAAADEAITEMEPAMKHVPRQALAGEVVEASKSRNVSQVMTNLQKQAKDTLNLCNTNMLYKARDAYQKVANTMASAFKEIENKQEYISTLGNYAAAVTHGMESRQQAVRKCIREFNNKGIPAFVDKRGREWTPEAYVNMAMRNTVKNTADEVQTARCRDYGVNLVAIDSHSGARPKCAKDQGKIYDLDNGSGYVEDLNGKKIQYYPWNSTSYGEPDGLLGINCGHHKYPFWPGLSLQRYFPVEDQEASDKLYQKTQVQRALERDVRKSKRECMLLDEAGDKEGFEAAAIQLKAKEAKLAAYVNADPELHRRKDREQVVGFDKSTSAKAVGANKRREKEKQAAGITTTAEVRDKKIKNYSSDKEQFDRYKKIFGDDIPDKLDEFQELKYNDSKKWAELKHDYRVLNSYEMNSGSMSNAKILELDQKAFDIKTKQFTGRAKRQQTNIAVMELDGEFKVANSQVNRVTDYGYINFKGDKEQIVLAKEKPQFDTITIGSHARDIDSEAKLFEYAATIAQDGKAHTINLLSEKCMCDSCLGVMEQFKAAYPNVSINAVSNKKERAVRNKNKPWESRKG